MCGIAGINWDDRDQIIYATNMLSHRGPDMSDFYNDENISLGHRRLSIIDLSERGRQPMTDREGRIVIVFNGEIYNYQEIRQELSEYQFNSDSDTEVVIYAYKKWGIDCVSKFNGGWAFALYDIDKKLLFLSRDRFGKKPLYYYFKDGKLVFGSEMKAIYAFHFPLTIDPDGLGNYLTYGYIPSPLSIFNEIKKVKNGHTLVFDLKNKQIVGEKPYWNLASWYSKTTKSKKEVIAEIRRLVDKSVQYRLVSDVPVGAFLSGGIDSSAVVATMMKYKEGEKVHTFSIGFDDPTFDETVYANYMADRLGTTHHVKEMTADESLYVMKEELPKVFDEPFGDPGAIPSFLVAKLAKEKVTVVLTGDGGDELFGGYKTYQLFRYMQLAQKVVPKFAYKPLQAVTNRLTKIVKNRAILNGLTGFQYLGVPDYMLYAKIRSHCKDIPQPYPKALEADKRYFIHKNWVDNVTYDDLSFYLPEDGCPKVDRTMMANAVEGRSPLMDKDLVRLGCSIKGGWKVNGGLKLIFKEAMTDRLPYFILSRQKQGFSPPVAEYIKDDDNWRGFIRDNIAELLRKDVLGSYISRDAVWKAFDTHIDGERDYTNFIYSLATLNIWAKRYDKM